VCDNLSAGVSEHGCLSDDVSGWGQSHIEVGRHHALQSADEDD
jgi:hypothetical protein